MKLAVQATEFVGADVLDCVVLPKEIQLVVGADPPERKDTGGPQI